MKSRHLFITATYRIPGNPDSGVFSRFFFFQGDEIARIDTVTFMPGQTKNRGYRNLSDGTYLCLECRARYMRHSKHANARIDWSRLVVYALRPIEADEEITLNWDVCFNVDEIRNNLKKEQYKRGD